MMEGLFFIFLALGIFPLGYKLNGGMKVFTDMITTLCIFSSLFYGIYKLF